MTAALLLAAGLTQCLALEARGVLDEARPCFIEIINTSDDPLAIATSYGRLGDLDAANDWFRRAVTSQPDRAEVRVAWGRLFASVHQSGDAEALFREALEIEPGNLDAQLGLAALYVDRFEGGAQALLATVLAADPGNPRARLLDARLRLELGHSEPVRADLEQLLDEPLDSQVQLETLALLAASEYMHDPGSQPGRAASARADAWIARALAINPRFGDAYAVPARFFVITRRYAEAVALYERAVAVQPDLWRARADLGVNLLRVNRLREARTQLEAAYAGDPYNVITVNTLRLLDSLDGYDTTVDPTYVLRTNPQETAAVRPIVSDMVDRARRIMAPRYGFELSRPVIIELYEHHDDFAVRTAGLPGIGILGAAFGDVVVMDGPAAKRITEGFDWASALWHEIAHVVTLGATGNRVSRWFSEGISELEEWETGPSQRRSIPLVFLEAWLDDRLLGIASLDEGFLRPAYPDQVMVSYLQAGLVCQYIRSVQPDGLTRMLRVYRDGGDTIRAIEEGLELSPESLDEGFAGYLNTRFANLRGGLDEFRELGGAVTEALAAEDWAGALEAGQAAIALYPEYVEIGSPYAAVVRAAQASGKLPLALDTARAYLDAGAREPQVLELLAGHAESAEQREALTVLARSLPLDREIRAMLGDVLLSAGDYRGAFAEYSALLSLDPHDRAAAHYRLAAALRGLGETADARRELLLALEIAPRYPDALTLLLELEE